MSPEQPVRHTISQSGKTENVVSRSEEEVRVSTCSPMHLFSQTPEPPGLLPCSGKLLMSQNKHFLTPQAKTINLLVACEQQGDTSPKPFEFPSYTHLL